MNHLKIIAAAVVVFVVCVGSSWAADKPNVLFIMSDDHCSQALGAYASRLAKLNPTPTLDKLRGEGMTLRGPLPADTAFTPAAGHKDAVLAMYHDQGLPVLKYAGFGKAVNVTLGLPIIRTSVDHGTAFDIAGSGTADPGSLFAAVELAVAMARGR